MSMEPGGVGAASNHSTAKVAQSRNAADAGADGAGTAPFVAVLATTMEPAGGAAPQAAEAPPDDTAPNAVPPTPAPDPADMLAQNQNWAGTAGIADHAALAAAQPEIGDPVAPGTTPATESALATVNASDAPGMVKTGRKADARSPGSKPSAPHPTTGMLADAAPSRPADAARLRAAHTLSRAVDTGTSVLEAGGLSAAGSAAMRATALHRASEAAGAELHGIAAPAGGAAATSLSFLEGSTLVREAVGPRAAERSVFRPFLAAAATGVTGSWTEHALSGGGPSGGVTRHLPDVGVTAPALSVAERMYYWISRGVQNAELQLDAFAGGSVEISISVQGSAAQVEFRSDQPEARKVLHDAMPHLKDLLKGEGLSLSAGFVGTSAQQDSNAPQQRAYPQRRVSTVRLESVPSDLATGPRHTPGRTVDVFV